MRRPNRFSNVAVQRQELDYYKDMERVAFATIGLLETSDAPMSTRLSRVEKAVKRIRYCEKQAALASFR
jgi:hypothetical protein